MVKATLVLGALGSLSYIAIMLSATVAGLDGDAASGLLGAATFAVVVGLLVPDARLGSHPPSGPSSGSAHGSRGELPGLVPGGPHVAETFKKLSRRL